MLKLPQMSSLGLHALLTGFVFAFGASVGSFLNVCIYRMPHGLSVVAPGSRCGACKKPIAWYDNIPLISWLLLRGRCRHCGESFSIRYWFVELLTACLFLGVWLKYGPSPVAGMSEEEVLTLMHLVPSWNVPIYWLVLGGLIAAAFIDLDHYIIPDEISIGGTVVGFLISVTYPALHGEMFGLGGAYKSVLGILVGSGIVLWIAIFGELLFKKEAMGFGDVKFMGMIGAFLGWQAAVFTLVAASVFGALVGGLWILLSKERRAMGKKQEQPYHSLDEWNLKGEMDAHAMRSSIPYGPFLALGGALWIFVGDAVRQWYAYFFELI